MDSVELRQVNGRIESVTLHKHEWIPLLRVDVYSNYIETGAIVAHSRAASTAEQIEE